jgi:hypothetical protein
MKNKRGEAMTIDHEKAKGLYMALLGQTSNAQCIRAIEIHNAIIRREGAIAALEKMKQRVELSLEGCSWSPHQISLVFDREIKELEAEATGDGHLLADGKKPRAHLKSPAKSEKEAKPKEGEKP